MATRYLRLAAEGKHSKYSHEGPIHLLLTDLVMPGMSGKTLAEELVKMSAETAIIFMSGYSSDVLSQQKIQSDHVLLHKPLRLQTMAQYIRQALTRAEKAE